MWAPIAEVCATAARSQTAQEYLLATHYQSTAAVTLQPPSERQLRGWLDGTSNTRRLPNYHTMVRQCLNIPTAPRRIANVQICCPGCHTESTVDGLTRHAEAVPAGAVWAPRFAGTTMQNIPRQSLAPARSACCGRGPQQQLQSTRRTTGC
jgi:hypothetical protein